MFNEIQGRVWPELARRLFGGARVYNVAPEISVQVGLFDRPELWALIQGNLLAASVTVAAGGAGTRSECYIRNPFGSSVITIVETLFIRAAAAINVEVGIATSTAEPGSSTGNMILRDTRRATTVGSSGPVTSRIRTSNVAGASALGSQVMVVGCLIGTWTEIPLEWVLAPGWHLVVRPDTDNQALNIAIKARERIVSPDELAVL